MDTECAKHVEGEGEGLLSAREEERCRKGRGEEEEPWRPVNCVRARRSVFAGSASSRFRKEEEEEEKEGTPSENENDDDADVMDVDMPSPPPLILPPGSPPKRKSRPSAKSAVAATASAPHFPPR